MAENSLNFSCVPHLRYTNCTSSFIYTHYYVWVVVFGVLTLLSSFVTTFRVVKLKFSINSAVWALLMWTCSNMMGLLHNGLLLLERTPLMFVAIVYSLNISFFMYCAVTLIIFVWLETNNISFQMSSNLTVYRYRYLVLIIWQFLINSILTALSTLSKDLYKVMWRIYLVHFGISIIFCCVLLYYNAYHMLQKRSSACISKDLEQKRQNTYIYILVAVVTICCMSILVAISIHVILLDVVDDGSILWHVLYNLYKSINIVMGVYFAGMGLRIHI